jgi:hypothetical protein
LLTGLVSAIAVLAALGTSCLLLRLHGLLKLQLLVFGDLDVTGDRVKVLRASLACYFEAVQLRLEVVNLRREHDHFGVSHQEHLCYRCAEKGTVETRLARRDVDFVALGTNDFDAASSELVTETVRQGPLLVTEGPRTETIMTGQIPIIKRRHACNCALN